MEAGYQLLPRKRLRLRLPKGEKAIQVVVAEPGLKSGSATTVSGLKKTQFHNNSVSREFFGKNQFYPS